MTRVSNLDREEHLATYSVVQIRLNDLQHEPCVHLEEQRMHIHMQQDPLQQSGHSYNHLDSMSSASTGQLGIQSSQYVH